MAAVTLEDVRKVYPSGVDAVAEFDLAIDDGELMVLVGPSGCGKSTVLRMVAGLEDISSGTLRIGDRVVNDLAPKDRDVAMVFQNYALYPHMTVARNIGFALKLRGLPKNEIDKRVREAARILQLEEWLERKPSQLSGGQRQRVAMGRAIVREPAVFLMDEPLSNLDAKLRVQTRTEIVRLQRQLKTTTLYVTHDQVEAMTMGDRVAVMRAGRLQQVGAPEQIYDDPDNLFVAAFIGSPSMNLLEAHVEGDAVVLGDDIRFPLPASVLDRRPALRAYDGRSIVVGIRPEALEDASLAPEGDARFRAEVELRESLGSEVLAHLRVAVRPAVTDESLAVAADVDEAALESLERQASAGEAKVVAKLDPRTRVRAGDVVELSVDVDRLHFFDAATTAAIRS